MNTVFIYALKDPDTGLIRYVGKAMFPQKRLNAHCFRADKEKDHRSCWINSLLKKGRKPLLEILDEVLEAEWPQWEVAWIEFFQESGFDLTNSIPGGTAPPVSAQAGENNNNFGKSPSAETRAKISAANTGQKRSAETRARLSAAKIGEKNHNFGKHLPVETRAKMSAANTGRISSAETCARKSAGLKGRKFTPEHCANISAARKLMWVFKRVWDLSSL